MLTVHADFSSLLKNYSDLEKRKIPQILSMTVDNLGSLAKKELENDVKSVFDRPTRYIQNAFFLKRSQSKNMTAIVGIKDQSFNGIPASKILKSEITGGQRRLKRYEKALQAMGVLPPGHVTAPGDGAVIDSYGNVSGKQIKTILSYFKENPESGLFRVKLRKQTKKKIGLSYFVLRNKAGQARGIWKRMHSGGGSSIAPVLFFINSAIYKPVLSIVDTTKRVIYKNFELEFAKAYYKVITR